MDSQKSEIEVAHEEKLNNEEFSIINLEQAPKKVQMVISLDSTATERSEER